MGVSHRVDAAGARPASPGEGHESFAEEAERRHPVDRPAVVGEVEMEAVEHLPGVGEVEPPLGRGTGGSKYPDLKAEFNAEPHVRGTASMARAQNPHSANSQFFICFDDARFLDRQYTVWGKVVEGMENVDKIKRGEPVVNPDRMISVKVMADIAA
jgi:hypothetical protein